MWEPGPVFMNETQKIKRVMQRIKIITFLSIVINTENGILVANMDERQKVKTVIQELKCLKLWCANKLVRDTFLELKRYMARSAALILGTLVNFRHFSSL
jgi:hypothetical protein